MVEGTIRLAHYIMWYNPVLLLEYLIYYVCCYHVLRVSPLQDSLGGNAKTNLVANVHPSGRYVQHSALPLHHTLNHTLNHKIAHVISFKEYDWLKIM